MEDDQEVDINLAAKQILRSKYLIASTGAGFSTESGIPDFRGPDGVWTKYGEPSMDGFQRFMEDPSSMAKELMKPKRMSMIRNFLGSKPNPGHYALAELEEMGILKCLITQNVDNLHRAAGNKNVLEFHGNVYRLRCLTCNSRFDLTQSDDIREHRSRCNGRVKTDAVMFGEPIPQDVLRRSFEEAKRCDCLIVAGTSAVVYPAASLPGIAKEQGATIIEINGEETHLTYSITDNYIKGKTGEVLPRIVKEIKGL
ncbi:MAG: NAD-dependent deacylase [Halobacteriota archaeon]|nr:NAD-dependent deacylase [Halobacteriota archaeon]